MRRLMIIGCIVMACTGYVRAQEAAPARQETVAAFSKKDFSEKVAEFDKLVRKGEREKAEAAFTDMKNVAYTELGSSRDKMRAATNEEDKKKYGKLAMDQRVLFAGILNLQQKDMVGNRKEIVSKLYEFADNTE